MNFTGLSQKSDMSFREYIYLQKIILGIVITELDHRDVNNYYGDYELDKSEYVNSFNLTKRSMGSDFENHLNSSLNSINNDINSIVKEFDKYFRLDENKLLHRKMVFNNLTYLKIAILNLSNEKILIETNILYKERASLRFRSLIKADMIEKGHNPTDEEVEEMALRCEEGNIDIDTDDGVIRGKDRIKSILKDSLFLTSKFVLEDLKQDVSEIILEFINENNKLDVDENNKLNADENNKLNPDKSRYKDPNYGKYWADRTAKDEYDTPGGWFDD